MADAADTLIRQVLERHLATVAVQVHTAVGSRIAVRRQGVVCAAGIVASTLTGIFAQEHATCIHHLRCQLLVVVRLDDQVLRRIGVREVDGLALVLHQHHHTVLQRLLGYLLTRQHVQLAVHLSLHVEYQLLRGRDQQHLRVDAVLSLRQQVGSHELHIGVLIRDDTYLRRTCRHVDGHSLLTHLLLGSHHVLVARTEYLVDLGNRLRAVSHRADGLYATSLEDLAHACDSGSHEDGWIHLAVTTWRRAEHNLLATRNLRRCGEHQDGREEWGSTTRDIETHLLDGDALLPANDARLCLHLLCPEALCLVEGLYVVVSQLDGSLQVCIHQLLSLFHLLVAHLERRQVHVVELQFVALHGVIAASLHVGQHSSHRIVQFRRVEMWSLHNLRPVLLIWKTNDIHS